MRNMIDAVLSIFKRTNNNIVPQSSREFNSSIKSILSLLDSRNENKDKIKEVQNFIYNILHDPIEYLRLLISGSWQIKENLKKKLEGEKLPVLLIHGWLGTRGALLLLENYLKSLNFPVFSINLGIFNVADITRSAFSIHRAVENLLHKTAKQKVDIVGHSMGGLIGLYYIKKMGGYSKVRRFISMGTPYRGTWITLLGILTIGLISKSIWQMIPGSDFLNSLLDGPLPPPVEYYSIIARKDLIVPPENCILPNAHNIKLPISHTGLVVSDKVFNIIGKILIGEIAQSYLHTEIDQWTTKNGQADLSSKPEALGLSSNNQMLLSKPAGT